MGAYPEEDTEVRANRRAEADTDARKISEKETYQEKIARLSPELNIIKESLDTQDAARMTEAYLSIIEKTDHDFALHVVEREIMNQRYAATNERLSVHHGRVQEGMKNFLSTVISHMIKSDKVASEKENMGIRLIKTLDRSREDF